MSDKFKYLLVCAVAFFFASKAWGQDAKLVEAAKKEGERSVKRGKGGGGGGAGSKRELLHRS